MAKVDIKRVEELFSAMDRMAAVAEPSAMGPEEVAREIAVMRPERGAFSYNDKGCFPRRSAI